MINRPCFRSQLLCAVLACSLASLCGVSATLAEPPWTTNQPIVRVEKELYLKHTEPGIGVVVQQYNAGPAQQRIEFRQNIQVSDTYFNAQVRTSDNNGRSWSPPESISYDFVYRGGVKTYEGPDNAMPVYDPRAQVLIQPWDREIFGNGGKFYNFTYYRLSTDFGVTWTSPKQLKYEVGPDFDPDDPLNSSFLNTNNAYLGENAIVTSNGQVVIGAGATKTPSDGPAPGGQLFGAINFIGTWNGKIGAEADYTWQASNRTDISSSVSSRGLMETAVAQLKDGSILDVWRGSNANLPNADGHKWFSVGALGDATHSPTLGAVQELKYDDGTSFYSPSSIDRLFRSQLNGKLYWIGNITPTNPNGNLPRYPLVIAEIDETKIALIKSTVTLIADRESDQLSSVQYSNFSLLENAETHQIELFLSTYGAGQKIFEADAYHFTLTLLPVPEPPSATTTTCGAIGMATLIWSGWRAGRVSFVQLHPPLCNVVRRRHRQVETRSR